MKVVSSNHEHIKEAVQVLEGGGVVAHPADTCFGLAADAFNQNAFKKVQAIKGRDFNKPMSIMLPVVEQVRLDEYAKLDDFSHMVADKLFPSPVTLLLPKGPKIPEWYFPETDLIGVRVPMHELTQDLLAGFKGPLITTSANPSGEALCFNCSEVVRKFDEQKVQPDLVIEGKSSEYSQASTVIMVEADHVKVVRQGPVSAAQLEGILGVPVE